MRPLVLDTNILLDIFVFNDPSVAALKEALLTHRVKAFATPESILELADVISRPLFALESGRQKEILQEWQALSEPINQTAMHQAPWKCKDPDDQIFLDTAFTLRPAVLLSKDLALLNLAFKAAKENILITKDCKEFLL
jgi:putative PIN family toxin of toxin-antitoxin system